MHGKQSRHNVWGDQAWEPQRANVSFVIGGASPVGMYPLGATPSSLLNLTGNVWEWTASLYRPYPYGPEDGRNDPDLGGSRVVRGDPWGDFQWDARCAYRLRYVPDCYNDFLGFRVVVSLASSVF